MKEIKNLPGYFATEDGQIFSTKTNKYLAQSTTRGYKQIITNFSFKNYEKSKGEKEIWKL